MQFGTFDLADCLGGVLAHMVRLPQGKLNKGARVTEAVIAAAREAGLTELTVAILAPDDLGEDAAADRLAAALSPPELRRSEAATGRVNIYARERGLVRVDQALVKAVNQVNEGITLATVQHNQLLAPGDMVATVKIIPFAVPAADIATVIALLNGETAVVFHPLTARSVALIQTQLPGINPSVFQATEAATKQRLNPLHCPLITTMIVDHTVAAVRDAISQAITEGAALVLLCGASAICDRRDVMPLAVEASGGVVQQLGLPVDPGNLLMLAHIETADRVVHVIGLPGCARSPKLNGFDWVLHLLLANIPIDQDEIADMAVGGLLMEIASRPLPRKLSEARPISTPKIGGVLLAAGQSRRMGSDNKLLAMIEGKPMVRHCAETVLAAGIAPLVVVTGHEAPAIEAALAGLDVVLSHNAAYADGQATSIACGVQTLDAGEDSGDAVLIALGDMPLITAELVTALARDHQQLADSERRITFPVFAGRRGNPVIWGRAFFDELTQLSGDSGGRQIMGAHAAAVNSMGWADAAIHIDVDTPAALDELPHRNYDDRT